MTTAENIVDFLMEHCGQCGEDEPTAVPCPACGGDGTALGQLGHLMHYRCRQCGWDFSEDNSQAGEECGMCGRRGHSSQDCPHHQGVYKHDVQQSQGTPPKANILGDTTSMGIGGGGN